MHGFCLPVAYKNKSPGKRCGASVNFRIHQIAQPDAGSCYGNTNHQAVKTPDKAFTGYIFVVIIHCNNDSYCSSMTCKASLPDIQQFPGFCQVRISVFESYAQYFHRFCQQVPFIKQTMSQACTYNGSDYHIQKLLVNPGVREFFVFIEFTYNQ